MAKNKISFLLVIVVLSCVHTFSQTRVPQFKDFPAQGKYAGKNAPVIITGEDRMYRTRLKEAAQEKPNFAGHYVLAAWGCGAGCLMGAVIDVNTGKVHWFPHTICCWNDTGRDDNFTPIVFRLNSRLVVFIGLRNEQDSDQGAHFYEFAKTGFKYIRTIKSAATQPEIQAETQSGRGCMAHSRGQMVRDNVELSAGYKFGWSRPNGSIILTTNSLFDPAVEFQQNWSRCKSDLSEGRG